MQDSGKRVFPHPSRTRLHELFRRSPAQIVTDCKDGDEKDTFENEPRNGAHISGVNGVHQVAHIERGIDGCRRGKQHHQHSIHKNAFFFTNVRIHENPLLPKTFRNAMRTRRYRPQKRSQTAARPFAAPMISSALQHSSPHTMQCVLYSCSILHFSQYKKSNLIQRFLENFVTYLGQPPGIYKKPRP